MNNFVTQQDLEIYDSRPIRNGNQLRFSCGLSSNCRRKPSDRNHKSLCVNLDNGYFICHRCQTKGRLREFWEEKKPLDRKQKSRFQLAARFGLNGVLGRGQTPENSTESETQSDNLAEKMKIYQADFLNSPAEIYLEKRGISSETASLCGCGYAAKWEHWEKREGKWHLLGTDERVVFPVYDQFGRLVAIQGRAINRQHFASDKITKGDKVLGVFQTPGALNSKITAICEGAADALALKMCGLEAVALMGTSWPEWLTTKFGFRSILLATDADEAGDCAALKLQKELEICGAKIFRLRPLQAKDWAEVLEQRGAENLRQQIGVFAENINDQDKANAVINWKKAGRSEGAKFLAGLINDFEMRQVLYQL
jgi:DNA primase